MTEAAKSSNEKLSAALKLLDEAAKMKKEELTSVMGDQYSSLKEVFLSKEAQVAEHVQHAADSCREKTRQYTQSIEQDIQNKPWHYVAGAALGALLIGIHIGRK